MQNRWLYGALLSSFTLATLQRWAQANFLYWRYPWFDVPMHLLGGIAIGSTLVVMIRSFRPVLFLVLAVVLFSGWEFFEYVVGIPRESNYVFDTALDLLNDAIGATAAYAVARLTLWRSA